MARVNGARTGPDVEQQNRDGVPLPERNPLRQAAERRAKDRAQEVKEMGPAKTLYVGMNPASAGSESRFLKRKLRRKDLISITPGKVQGQIKHEGKKIDLNDAAARQAFAKSLGHDAEKTKAIEQLLQNTDPDARDEVGKLARAFSDAEHGKHRIERMILSGHQAGGWLFGEKGTNGMFRVHQTMNKLGEIFPKAAKGVEDVLYSSCNSGYSKDVMGTVASFKHLQSMVGYNGTAPAAPHSNRVIGRWLNQTKGDRGLNLSPKLGRGTHRSKNMTTWTRNSGVRGKVSFENLQTLTNRFEDQKRYLPDFLSGERETKNRSSGTMRNLYQTANELLGRQDTPDGMKAELRKVQAQAIRLIYYPDVASTFQKKNQEILNHGYAALGQSPPDFGKMSRKEAVAEIKRFTQVSSDNADVRRTASVLRGLLNLDARSIPANWL